MNEDLKKRIRELEIKHRRDLRTYHLGDFLQNNFNFDRMKEEPFKRGFFILVSFLISYLLAVLRDADLVKFAKATPEAEENELAYSKAYAFVEDTKPVEQTDEEEEDAPTKNEKEAKR